MGVDFHSCSICKEIVNENCIHSCNCGHMSCDDCSGLDNQSNGKQKLNDGYKLNDNDDDDGIFSKCPLCGKKVYKVEIDEKYSSKFEKLLNSKSYVYSFD